MLNFVVIKPLSDTAYRWCRKFVLVKCHNMFQILRSEPVSLVRQFFLLQTESPVVSCIKGSYKFGVCGLACRWELCDWRGPCLL